MSRRAALRRRLGWVALVVLACSVVASLRMHRRAAAAAVASACRVAEQDSVRAARTATDTIATLRGHRQHVRRYSGMSNGVEVRTEDDDALSQHDGGLAAFDCSGRLTFLWLDGG